MTTSAAPRPPKHLSAPTKRWWRQVCEDFELELDHLKLLQAACEAWDRMTQAREILEREGVTYVDRFGAPRKHPAVSIEENGRLAFARVLRELDLHGEPEPDTRPPRRR